jgi:hypothetical protein
MKKLLVRGFAGLLWGWAVAHAGLSFSLTSSVRLPLSDDIPSGPPGMEATEVTGGEGVSLSGDPLPGAPVIGMMSETARAGETFVGTGAGLDGVTYYYAPNGESPLLQSSLDDFFVRETDRSATVLPSDIRLNGTTLVFARKNGLFSRPFRINGPRLFWLSPSSVPRMNGNTSGHVLSICGKNLHMNGAVPRAYLSGPSHSGFFSSLEDSHENRMQLNLPDNLTAGHYTVWVHNGTGKNHGWSDPLSFIVYDDNGTSATVRQTPAPAGDPAANRMNIQALLDLGPGTVQLQSGNYVIDQPLVISNHFTTLTGISYGSGFDYESCTVTGATATILRYDGTNCLSELIHITGENSEVRNTVLINGTDGGMDEHQLIEVQGKTCTMQFLRCVMYDHREWGVGGPPREWADIRVDPNPTGTGASSALVDDGCIFFNCPGEVRGLVENCTFYTISTGVRVGTIGAADLQQDPPLPAVRQVVIRGNVFYGEYAGEATRLANSSSSGRATGVVIYNGQEIEITGNHFESADRAGRRLLNRSVLSFNSSTRNLYIADNTTFDCGTAGWGGLNNNQGEQYLFHHRYTKGGLFDVQDADPFSVVVGTNVEPEDPAYRTRWYAYDQRGSRVPDEVGTNDRWVAFITEGTGAGQYRRITGVSRNDDSAILHLEKPWRLLPDPSSRICLHVPIHQIILYNNEVDCGNEGDTKTHLATFWFDAADNVVRNNRGRNLSAGITVNGMLWGPSYWNLVESNSLSDLYWIGIELGSGVRPGGIAFQSSTTRRSTLGNTIWPVSGWFGVGNTARHNQIQNSMYGVLFANGYSFESSNNRDPFNKDGEEGESLEGKGMQLQVAEHNRFEEVQRGVFADCSAQNGIVFSNEVGVLSRMMEDQIEYRPEHKSSARIISRHNWIPSAEYRIAPVSADAEIRSGADADIRFGSGVQMLLRNTSNGPDVPFTDIKSYLRADVGGILNSVEGEQLAAAVLRLRSTVARHGDVEFMLYGIVDQDDQWSESGPDGITWNNAPKNDRSSGNGVLPGTVLLASLRLAETLESAFYSFSDPRLTAYLNWKAGVPGDPYGSGPSASSLATFILTVNRKDQFYGFASREAADAEIRPLLLCVPRL